MAQCLRTLDALAEDLGSILITRMTAHNHLTPVPRNSLRLFGTKTYKQAKYSNA